MYYFWIIAQEGSLTRAAQHLHISQSALSVQLRRLEEQLNHPLFSRDGRRLTLTEAGQIALSYAQKIFTAGDEMVNLLRSVRQLERQVLRVGAVATLSRNFQHALLQPLFGEPHLELIIHSGSLREMLTQLGNHSLDLVLSNVPARRDAEVQWQCRQIARQPVSLVGKPRPEGLAFRFPDDLRNTPLLLPSQGNDVRTAFDALLEQLDIRPLILAEVDDMAMLRLLARDTDGVTLVPPVVVKDELNDGLLVEHYKVPDLYENFYAITVNRQFQTPILKKLLQRSATDILED